MYTPVFHMSAIAIIFPAALVVVVEHIGHLIVTGNIVGKLAAAIQSIPVPVMGGVSLLLFGVSGAGVTIGTVSLKGMALSTIIAVVLSLAFRILSPEEKRA